VWQVVLRPRRASLRLGLETDGEGMICTSNADSEPAWSGEARNSGGAPVGRGARFGAARRRAVSAEYGRRDGERLKARVITPRSNEQSRRSPAQNSVSHLVRNRIRHDVTLRICRMC
jgi:hypothetical protein